MTPTLLHYDPVEKEYYPITNEGDYLEYGDEPIDISTLEIIANSNLTIAAIIPAVTHEMDEEAMGDFAEGLLTYEAIKYATITKQPYVMLQELGLPNRGNANMLLELPTPTDEGLAVGIAVLLKPQTISESKTPNYAKAHRRAN